MTRYPRYSLTYRYKKHWPWREPDHGLAWPSRCGKSLPSWAFADRPEEVTCKICRHSIGQPI